MLNRRLTIIFVTGILVVATLLAIFFLTPLRTIFSPPPSAILGPVRLFDLDSIVAGCRSNVTAAREITGLAPRSEEILPATPGYADPDHRYWNIRLNPSTEPVNLGYDPGASARVQISGSDVSQAADEAALRTATAPAWCFARPTVFEQAFVLRDESAHTVTFFNRFEDITISIFAKTVSPTGRAGTGKIPEAVLVCRVDENEVVRLPVPARQNWEKPERLDVPLRLKAGEHRLQLLHGSLASDSSAQSQAPIRITRIRIGQPAPTILMKTSAVNAAPAPQISYWAYENERVEAIAKSAAVSLDVNYAGAGAIETAPLRLIRLKRWEMPNTLTTLRSATLIPPVMLNADVNIPENCRLNFYFAFQNKLISEVPARVTVTAADPDSGVTLRKWQWDCRGKPENYWIPVSIDLSSLGARLARLTISITNDQDIQLPVHLGEPVLVSRQQVAHKRPNIILLSIDTLRADHVSAYGYSRATTPNLDALSADSARFSNAWTTASYTIPAHMSLFTGFFPLMSEIVFRSKNTFLQPLPPDLPTIASWLRGAGYRAVAFSGGGFVSAIFGFNKDFDEFNEQSQMSGFAITYKGIREYKDSGMHRAFDWLRANADDGPFFLFLHSYGTHSPFAAPPRLDSRFAEGIKTTLPQTIGSTFLIKENQRLAANPDEGIPSGDLAHIIAAYDRTIVMTDEEIGTLVKLLKELRLEQNTILLITSDHGEEFLEHHRFLHNSLFNELLRVPMILHYPARIPRGMVIKQPLQLVDVLPTVLDLAGLTLPESLQGRSLVPLLEGRTETGRKLVFAYRPDQSSVMDERLKLYLAKSGNGLALYDLEQDPAETQNLIADRKAVKYPELRRLMGALLCYYAQNLPGWNVVILPSRPGKRFSVTVKGFTADSELTRILKSRYQFSSDRLSMAFNSVECLTNGGCQLLSLIGGDDTAMEFDITELDAEGKPTGEPASINIGMASNRRMLSPVHFTMPREAAAAFQPEEFADRYFAVKNFEVFIWFNPLKFNPANAGKTTPGEESMESLKQLGYLN